jgi:hypothetical protein
MRFQGNDVGEEKRFPHFSLSLETSTYVYCTIYYQLVCFHFLIDLNIRLNIHCMAFCCYSGGDGDYLSFHRGLPGKLLQR